MILLVMARGDVNPANKEIPLAEIEKRIMDLDKRGRILKRLYLVKFRY
ncbi:hypothetical protein [Metallosphaera sp.]